MLTIGYGGDVSVVENAGPAVFTLVASNPAIRDVVIDVATLQSGTGTGFALGGGVGEHIINIKIVFFNHCHLYYRL